MTKTPLPSAKQTRELLEGLFGREMAVLTGGPMVDPAGPGGAVVAEYISDQMQLAALVVMDVPMAARAGAAIALMPSSASEAAVDDGELTDVLLENAGEILNVVASLFNAEGAPHVRLNAVHAPNEALPGDVAPWVMSYVARLDLECDIAGYGPGALSVLVL
ncbi:hypothetical protein SAMN05216410_2410 [Sanguibacter gelidistatuariae]|uniref:Chemotaxis phosphatase CheX n=1 Tax=Sanguibacter gelidistatuariae TaxID=1814289 RepID=A0A1G6Q0N0_9MICO|nr:hypothetical protein [Sanguibacter gelidistatuariae]SDC86022.1 hypothetical protein SAMN05216410_2410 [Sanguibacter gelidistatuariae]